MNTVVNIGKLHARKRGAAKKSPAAVWPINELSPTTANAWLMETIAGKPYESVAMSLWLHHPNLRIATERFGALVTPKWPTADGSSLLAMAIENAVCKVNEAVQRGESFEGRVVGVYLFWLVNSVADVARLAVYGVDKQGGLLRWPYFSEPLSMWAKHNEVVQLEAYLHETGPTDEEIAGLRTHLIAKITSNPVDAGYLEKHAPRG